MVHFPQGAIKVYPETPVEVWAPDQVLIDNALYGPERYGRLHLRENRADLFERWKKAGEEDQTIEVVPEQRSIGIMIPTKAREHQGNIAGITLADSVIELNMRDVGKYLSLHENFRQHLVNYIRSEEGQDLAAYLGKLGYKAGDIEYITIGFVPKEAIYAVGRLPNGKIVIYANKDSYKMLAEGAEAQLFDEGFYREAAIGEEFVHIFRDSKPSIAEESATKTMLMQFYETLAKTTSNTQLKAKYSRIVGHLKDDISTIDRYAKIGNNSLEELVDMYNADVGELVNALEAEAVYNGVNSVEGMKEYVSERLEEIAEAAENCEYGGEGEAEACEAEGEAAEGGAEGGEGGGE